MPSWMNSPQNCDYERLQPGFAELVGLAGDLDLHIPGLLGIQKLGRASPGEVVSSGG